MSNDAHYLSKLQDYYAAHGVVPPYSTLMQVMGFRSKSPVAALVNRLKIAGFLESTPDTRLRPGRRFFERRIYEKEQAKKPHPAAGRGRGARAGGGGRGARPAGAGRGAGGGGARN